MEPLGNENKTTEVMDMGESKSPVQAPSDRILVKRDFFKNNKLLTDTVDVPEWGGKVLVREMPSHTRDAYENWTISEDADKTEIRARIVAACVVDADGRIQFEEIDIPDLKELSGNILARIAKKAFQLSGLLDEVKDDMLKNSGTVPEGDSFSDSAVNLDTPTLDKYSENSQAGK